MIKVIILTILLFPLQSFAKQAKLIFSLTKEVEYDDFKTKATLTILDNKKFVFKTSTGGFHICSERPSGVFRGELSSVDYKELLSGFKEMDKYCSNRESCHLKKGKMNKDDFDWRILGWGDYSNKSYFLKSDTVRPKLFQTIFKLEKRMYQNPEFAVQISKVKETESYIRLKAKYLGAKTFEFEKGLSSLVILGKSKQRRLFGKPTIRKMNSGETVTFDIDKKKNNIQSGDYVIYSPPYKNEINNCIVAK